MFMEIDCTIKNRNNNMIHMRIMTLWIDTKLSKVIILVIKIKNIVDTNIRHAYENAIKTFIFILETK